VNALMENHKVWQNAAALSAKAHRFHTRKDGVTPYISHPVRVCMTLVLVFEVLDPEILSAALLHDVIEDTDTDFDDIHKACGHEVASIVAALSKDPRLQDKECKAMYRKQLAGASWKVKIIKMADIYDNICGLLVSRLGINMWTPALHAIEDAIGVPELQKASEILSGLLKAVESDKALLDGTKKAAKE